MSSESSLYPSVLISYASADRVFASKLAASLRSRGIKVWIDVEALSAGMPWTEQLSIALARAQLCLLIVSTASNSADPGTSSEWSKIQGMVWNRHDLKVMPVIIGEAEAPPFLRRWKAVRVSNSTEVMQVVEEVVRGLGSSDLEEATVRSYDVEQTKKRFDEIRGSLAELKNSY